MLGSGITLVGWAVGGLAAVGVTRGIRWRPSWLRHSFESAPSENATSRPNSLLATTDSSWSLRTMAADSATHSTLNGESSFRPSALTGFPVSSKRPHGV